MLNHFLLYPRIFKRMFLVVYLAFFWGTADILLSFIAELLFIRVTLVEMAPQDDRGGEAK